MSRREAGALALAAALGPAPPPQLMRERAFETIKDAIITGRLAPGARLIERELCEALNVSRSIVREVVRRLEAERLVEVAPHRGPRVVVLTAREAREIYALRAELEVMLVRDFIANGAEADVAALRDLLAEIAAAAARDDVPALVAIMRRFYAALTAGAGSTVVADILEILHARISRLRVLSMSEPGRARRSIGEIGCIVEAVAARNPVAAEAATRAYVGAALEAALRQLAAG